MRVPQCIKMLPVPAGALAVAVFSMFPREVSERRAVRVPPAWTEQTALRIQGAKLAAVPADKRAAALERMLDGTHRITAADAEWFLEMREKARAEGWEVTDRHWHRLLECWATAHPQEAAEFLEKRGLLAGTLAEAAPDAIPVLRAWARGDAASIFDWVKAGGEARLAWWNKAGSTFARAWVEDDAAAALAWVNAGGSAGVDGNIVGFVFERAPAENIDAWLRQHGADDDKVSSGARHTAVQLLAQRHLQNGGMEAAVTWAESLSRADEQNFAALAIMPSVTASAPEKTVAWLDSKAFHGQAATWLARDAMMKWTASDSATAGDWLNAHRHSPVAPAFIEAYAMSIAGDDPAAARQWIAQLPETPVTQPNDDDLMRKGAPPSRAALEHFVSVAEISTFALDDPARAAALAAALPGNEVRGSANYHIALVREAPGQKPVPRLTAVSPFL